MQIIPLWNLSAAAATMTASPNCWYYFRVLVNWPFLRAKAATAFSAS